MKIVKSLEESVLLMEGIGEIIKNEAKEQNSKFLPLLLANVVSILGNTLSGGVIRACQYFQQKDLL